MTKRQLNSVRLYNSELRLLRRHLNELEEKRGISSIAYDGQPHGTNVGKPTEEQAVAIADTIMKIRILEEKIQIEKDIIWDYITKIQDTKIRQIIILRFIDGKSWFKVSLEMGGDATEEGCRKAFERFFNDN